MSDEGEARVGNQNMPARWAASDLSRDFFQLTSTTKRSEEKGRCDDAP